MAKDVFEVSRQVQDSVFTHYFSTKEHLAELYEALHPGESITPDEIELYTLSHDFVHGQYNDVGFLAKGELIVLMEAQSTWTPRILLRMFGYAADTYRRYFASKGITLYSGDSFTIPETEFHCVVTGQNKRLPSKLSLRDDFFHNPNATLNFEVNIIQRSRKGDALWQYIEFTNIFKANALLYGRNEQAVAETLNQCIAGGIFVDYFKASRREVMNILNKEMELEIARQCLNDELLEQGRIEGRDEGRREGRSEGRDEGLRERSLEVARAMIRDGFGSAEDIAKYTGLTLAEVKKLSRKSRRGGVER